MIIYTWVFNNARGSLLLMILLHACYDIAFTLGHPNRWLWTLAYVIVALLAIATTRGQLSYECYQQSRYQTTEDRHREKH